MNCCCWPRYVLVLGVAAALAQGAVQDSCTPERQPNVIFILCDDVGWDDIGLHGNNQIPTPNIDAILTHGVALHRYYSAPMCTPARSSLMTGKYASETGMQHYVIPNDQPYALGLEHKLLPEYLGELGYSTHMVGKWHLGFYREEYTATYRGFETFFGYQGGMIDYYEHTSDSINNGLNFTVGYDMRRNTTFAWDTQGQYATDLFTDVAVDIIHKHNPVQPLFLFCSQLAAHAGNVELTKQAPDAEIAKFAFIKDKNRRAYAAVMSKLDESVGRVMTALKDRGLLENSVIVFAADNGAPVVGELHNAGSNFPFRGQKDSPWEAASRVVGGIYAPFLQASQRVSTELFHVTDWLPTIVHLAGGTITDPTVSGVNQWPSLCQNLAGPRYELLVNIDPAEPGPYRSIIVENWKLVVGTNHDGNNDGWLCDEVNVNNQESHPSFCKYGQSVLSSPTSKAIAACTATSANVALLTPYKIEQLRKKSTVRCNNVPRVPCNPLLGPCLFNLLFDPCERLDLSEQAPDVLRWLQRRLDYFEGFMVAPKNRPDDPRSNPLYFNGTWAFWYDELHICGD